jgi:hypothetical protein
MDVAEVHEQIDVVAARCSWTGAAAAIGKVRSWLDGQELEVAAHLADTASFPEQALADAEHASLRDATRVLDRCQTVRALPDVGAAAVAGELSAAHVDVFTRALRRLEPGQRDHFAERAAGLAELASRASPEELGRAVAAEVRRITWADGLTRLERLRRNIRVRTWVDDDGMWCLKAQFDPETGVALHQRLDAVVGRMFAEQTPEDAPSDPIERQGFLRARGLAALIMDDHRPSRPPASEVVVVVDATAVDDLGQPAIDWGLPVDLPIQVLHEHFDRAEVEPVVVRGGLVVHASGQRDLGRSTRLANKAQRRVLRGLYPTCAIPGCQARFDRCKLHHVVWWEHGGATDLVNLLPLCVQHHHAVHDRGWRLTLSPDRQLTVDFPDGTRQTTGPPRRGPTHPPPSRRPPEPTEPIEPIERAEFDAPERHADRLQPLRL